MNLEIVLGRLCQWAGKARVTWGELTHDELCRTSGLQQILVGQMREAGGEAVALLHKCSQRAAANAQPR